MQTALEFQADPAGYGKRMHRVERAADPNVWSVRAGRELRLIVQRDGDTLVLAYAGHHDEADRWATRKKLQVHERTGAMQLIEVCAAAAPEVLAIVSAPFAAAPVGALPDPQPLPVQRPFADLSDDRLLDVGVPCDWLAPIRSPTPMRSVDSPSSTNVQELRAALEFPFEKWAVFLHPLQRALVERRWSGPARVSRSAGTGKTIVALHRAVHLARGNAQARVLLATCSWPLAAGRWPLR